MALEAGIDLRTVIGREAERARGTALRSRLEQVSREVARGTSLPDALADTGDFFPGIFRNVVAIGDHTGHLPEACAQLAEHYEYQVKLQRDFLGAIAWPMFQLSVAILVVGFLIWILGIIGGATGTTTDVLGWGLVGNSGLAIYSIIVGTAIGVVAVLVRSVRRGLGWTRGVQKMVLKVPMLGAALETMALARLAWTLHLTLNAGMEIRRAVVLSLESTRNAHYQDQIPQVEDSIRRGNSLFETFSDTHGYPPDFLDSLRVGEQSGRVVESMAVLSRQYRERATAAMGVLTTMAGFAVWAIVAALIILMIFRIFSFYLGTLQDALH